MMCGICGLIEFAGTEQSLLAQQLAPVAAALEHRGPDGTRLTGDEKAVLGACRLTIRGPAGGVQPLAGISGVLAVCNGEIDNHPQLRRLLASRGREVSGASDVDLLPALYEEFGPDFVSRLEGAFALAIWDPNHQQLLLARDRAGERPLFFAQGQGSMAFASEVSALLRIPWVSRDLDVPALWDYLRRGHFVAPATPYRRIRKLGPGELLVSNGESVRLSRFWRWSLGESDRESSSVAEFDVILREAVRRQTENDVPFGIFLSGGLDSSLVAAIASRSGARPPSRAFTLRFAEKSYDEGEAARRAARLLDLPLTEVEVRAEQFPPMLDRLCAVSGEPLADPAWVPTALLSEEAARTVRVALVGEGADEIFGGYPTYLGIAAGDFVAHLPRGLVSLLRAAAASAPLSERKVPISFLVRKFAEGLDFDGLERHRFWTAAIPDSQLARCGAMPPLAPTIDAWPRARLLDAAQRFDFETSLAEGLLTKSDRAAMLSALELRAPFLDSAILEWAAHLPPEQRVQRLRTKIFLKRYGRTMLPPSIMRLRKRGLSVPISRWLRGELRGFAVEALRSERLDELGVDRNAVARLLAAHLDRREDHGRALWTLIVLSRWLTTAAATVEPRSHSGQGIAASPKDSCRDGAMQTTDLRT